MKKVYTIPFISSFVLLVIGVLGIQCSGSFQPDTFTLPSGLKVYLINQPSTITSAVYMVRCPEFARATNLTRVTNKMLLHGSEVRTVDQIYEQIESLGGKLTDQTGESVSWLAVQAPKDHFETCFQIFLECITRPSFDEDQIKKISPIPYQKKREFSLTGRHWNHNMIVNGLYEGSFSPEETKSKVSFSREDIIQHYEKCFRPDQAVLLVVGNYNNQTIRRDIRKYWDGIKKPSQPPIQALEFFHREEVEDKVIQYDRPMDHVMIAYRVPPSSSESFYTLFTLTNLLASGRSSMINDRLHNEGKHNSRIGMIYQHESPYPYVVLDVYTSSGEGMEAKKFVLDEMERLIHKGINSEALERAKRKTQSSFLFIYQYTLHTAEILAFTNSLDLPYQTRNALESRFNRVTLEESNQVLQNYFSDPVVWVFQGK
jgi:zinc protease